MIDIDEFAEELHQTAIDKGFWSGEPTTDKIMAKLALVHSEVTETLEAIRKDEGSQVIVDEMADTIIRVLDLYAAMRKPYVLPLLSEALTYKAARNANRPALHGHKWG